MTAFAVTALMSSVAITTAMASRTNSCLWGNPSGSNSTSPRASPPRSPAQKSTIWYAAPIGGVTRSALTAGMVTRMDIARARYAIPIAIGMTAR